MCYCKLLENRAGIMTLLHVHDPPVLSELNYEIVFIVVRSRERGYFLTKLFILFWLRDHRHDGEVAVRGTGNLVR